MENKWRSTLVEKGLKVTPHRECILKIIEDANIPFTAEEIYLELKKNALSTCLSTVYRTLEAFEEKELVIKSNSIDDGKSRYQLFTKDHRHQVICLECHKIILIDECPFEEFKKVLKEKTDFNITGHKFEVYGHCKACQGN